MIKGKNRKILALLLLSGFIIVWYLSSKSSFGTVPAQSSPAQNCSSMKCLPDADPPLHFITKSIFKL